MKTKTNETKQKSEVAQCASLIRADLKKAFPATKFSVTSSSFSMGNSVDISWTDGPSSDEVEVLVKDYQDGYFDGMEDIYNYYPNPENKPRAKYVCCRRETTKEFEAEICASLGEPLENRDFRQDQRVYSLMRKTNWVAKQKLPTPEERYEAQDREFRGMVENGYKIVVTEVAK